MSTSSTVRVHSILLTSIEEIRGKIGKDLAHVSTLKVFDAPTSDDSSIDGIWPSMPSRRNAY
jgi:hypothetical protein